MKRSGMIRGPRRSAKQVVIAYVNRLLKMLDSPDLPPDRRKEFRNHLGAILMIAKDMNWTDLSNRVSNYVRSHPSHPSIDGPLMAELKVRKGVFTEPD